PPGWRTSLAASVVLGSLVGGCSPADPLSSNLNVHTGREWVPLAFGTTGPVVVFRENPPMTGVFGLTTEPKIVYTPGTEPDDSPDDPTVSPYAHQDSFLPHPF